jgi:hypothetical protein
MHIQLNDSDMEKMPQTLRSALLLWLENRSIRSSGKLSQQASSKVQKPLKQLTLALNTLSQPTQEQQLVYQSTRLVVPESHVRMTQLFNAGITKSGMLVRVRLVKELEKQLGYRYVTFGLSISASGTVFYNPKEFDKPSPLVKQVTGQIVNSWEYVEVQKNGIWVCLGELRRILRSVS